MINITKTISVTGTPPINIIVNSSASQLITQISDNIFKIDLSYASEEDIDGLDTITVFDANGCIKSASLQVANICESFIVSDITKVGGNNNESQTSLGEQSIYTITSNQDINIEWSIDDPEYYTTQIEGNTILLTQIDSGIQSTNLRAVIKNEAGCEETRRLTLNPCRVLTQSSSRTLYLRDEGDYYTASNVALRASSSCQNSNINWSTVNISNPANILFEQINNGPTFNISSNVAFNTTRVPFNVRDNNNILSNTSYIELNTEEVYTGIGDVTTDGFGSEPTITSFGEDTFSVALNELGFPSGTNLNGLSVNNSLTTANTATISNLILNVDATGQQIASVGFNQESGLPLLIAFVRQLSTFSVPAEELVVTCTPSTLDVTTLAGVTGATSIISGEATLSNNIVTITEPNQVVTVNVTNEANQSAILRINSCGGCIPTTNVTLCDSVINPYDLLPETANASGTWTVVSGGGPLPNSYNSDIALVGTGNFVYSYSSPNTAGDYNCVTNSTHVLNINKIAASSVANDVCANATALASVTDNQTLLSVGSISDACNNSTSWSGNSGNKLAHTYDQWFSFDSNSTSPLDTLKLTVKVIGINATPINIPDLQLWSACNTTLANVTYSQTVTTATAVYTFGGGANVPFLLQVLANNVGDFRIEIEQKIL